MGEGKSSDNGLRGVIHLVASLLTIIGFLLGISGLGWIPPDIGGQEQEAGDGIATKLEDNEYDLIIVGINDVQEMEDIYSQCSGEIGEIGEELERSMINESGVHKLGFIDDKMEIHHIAETLQKSWTLSNKSKYKETKRMAKFGRNNCVWD